MESNWQTWAALIIVNVAALLLARTVWHRRRMRDHDCGCPGTKQGREFDRLRKKFRARR